MIDTTTTVAPAAALPAPAAPVQNRTEKLVITKDYLHSIAACEGTVKAIAAKVAILAFPVIILITLLLDLISSCCTKEQEAPVETQDAPVIVAKVLTQEEKDALKAKNIALVPAEKNRRAISVELRGQTDDIEITFPEVVEKPAQAPVEAAVPAPAVAAPTDEVAPAVVIAPAPIVAPAAPAVVVAPAPVVVPAPVVAPAAPAVVVAPAPAVVQAPVVVVAPAADEKLGFRELLDQEDVLGMAEVVYENGSKLAKNAWTYTTETRAAVATTKAAKAAYNSRATEATCNFFKKGLALGTSLKDKALAKIKG